MAFPPPRPHSTESSLSPASTTASSILSFREFFGGGVISGQIRTVSSQSFVPFGPPVAPVPRRSYRIKWLEFERQLASNFADLYTSVDSTDLSIMCGVSQEIVRAHQMVLSMGSLYFRDALKIVPCKHPTVVVRNLSGHYMRKILDYVYLGQASFKTEVELNSFMDGAKYLQVLGIQEGKYTLSF